jgi:hypothetical protein
MAFKSVLHVRAGEHSFVLIVEPWAEEFTVAADAQCQVVAFNAKVLPTFDVEPSRTGGLIVYVNEGGSTYEFWRGGGARILDAGPDPGIDLSEYAKCRTSRST